MENIYGALFTIGGALSAIALLFLIRWANDARFVGWRLRRWHERGIPEHERPWTLWFAWRPVKTVSGELIWWSTIYRKLGNGYIDMDDWTWYYYGTVFEVLKGNSD